MAGGTQSKALTLTTAVANDLILVLVGIEGGSVQGTVSSVTSSHLTFTKRWGFTFATGKMRLELWWARASGTLSSEVITTTLAGTSQDGWCNAIQAFQNCNSFNNGFDPNGALPGNQGGGGSAGATPTCNVSTTNADDLLLAMYTGNNNPATAQPSGYTSICNFVDFSAGLFSNLSWCYKSVSTTQSAVAQNWASGSTQDYQLAGDALTADGAASPKRSFCGNVGF
jgi:hypothetical protein